MAANQAHHGEPTHRITVTLSQERTGGRVFGVLSAEGGNVIATSLTTLSPKAREGNQYDCEHDATPRYEHLKDCYTLEEETKEVGSDYVSRVANKLVKTQSSPNPVTEHTKSRSDESDAKSKGKYGSVWKTPQTQHGRAKSANLATDWDSRNDVMPRDSGKEPERNEKMRKTHHTYENVATAATNDEPIDNFPSVLRALQNSKLSVDYRYKSKAPADNYEKVWPTETSTTQNVKNTNEDLPPSNLTKQS